MARRIDTDTHPGILAASYRVDNDYQQIALLEARGKTKHDIICDCELMQLRRCTRIDSSFLNSHFDTTIETDIRWQVLQVAFYS